MANLLLILVSRINMTLAATAIICSHAAFVLIPVLFLLIPRHQGLGELLEWFWGLFLPSPLTSSLLQLTHALSTERNRERGKQNPVRKEKSISLRGMQKERESFSRGVWALSMGRIMSTHVFSTQSSVQISTTLHFRVKSPWKRFLPCRWDQKGQRNTTSYTRMSCETPVITPHFSSPQLSLLLLHTIPTLSLEITRAKSFIVASTTAVAKLNFAHLVWKFWSSSVRNKPHGNHIYISFQLEEAL